jgi:hypothetical protein
MTSGLIVLPNTGTLTGLSLVDRINTQAATIATRFASATAPTTASTGLTSLAGIEWHDTGNNLIKIRDQADTAWITVEGFDETNKIHLSQVGGGTATVASASTTDLGSSFEASITISGTVTITSFGSSAPKGAFKFVTFGGALTLTYNATSLKLPTSANIVTVAGDTLVAEHLGSGNWKVHSYQRVTGEVLLGGFLQQVRYTTGTVATGTTLIPLDNTIPQNTEGDEYMTLAITPKSATSILVVQVIAQIAVSTNTNMTTALFRDTTANALAAVPSYAPASAGAYGLPLVFNHYLTSGSTSATTFKVRVGASASATTTFNGILGTAFYNGVMSSSIIITEYAA